jgi:hypothetical protein
LKANGFVASGPSNAIFFTVGKYSCMALSFLFFSYICDV